MTDPYRLDTPAVVSFSGGRTSGYLLWHVLQAFGGTLPDDVKVVFCNTGKERPETLDFVERCSQRWGVPVTWLEYRYDGSAMESPSGPKRKTPGRHSFAVVDYATASRNGEPLDAVIRTRWSSGYLPNPLVRYCTIEAKILTTIRYLKALGWDHWTNAIGFRADEPTRLAKLAAGVGRCQDEDAVAPLAVAGVRRSDVLAWWKGHPFDLELEPWESNCDGCFLRDKRFLLAEFRRHPERADWWIGHESRGGRFRNDRADYATLLQLSKRPGLFDDFDPEAADELSVSCHCTD